MIVRAALACTALAIATTPALGPIEVEAYGPSSGWFCTSVRDWQAVMRRDHRDADRSLPEIERRCHLPRGEVSR
ncbi:hypothetical protein MCBMB27_02605 [Methylobacterium phyllosphaerae]|uniref:Secreted protein n=1 Tax=Methylobacterium phyllosphaerae TaxID=418223 RepID=A0AAE8L6Z8_9HYPH|nr:hypothetical protein [Methylobacterium phyllosphaerae]APT31896.1 hypothetical protein MCBMB27_02605 [Methylobacterium phyllosphaerae]SFH01941.1 hypothetical protein SAMN05192567_11262 [Methylobacterium phyllosphaerae]